MTFPAYSNDVYWTDVIEQYIQNGNKYLGWYNIDYHIMIAILLFIRWSLKGDVRLKWIFSGCIFISVIVTTVLGISLSKIYLDIKNKDYVTYCGQYVERGGGQQELKTLVVYDESGKEIRLLRTGPSEKGLYKGTVVYGRRSRIVVEYDGISIE